MKISCPSCSMEYEVRCQEAKEEGIEPSYCPFCGFESSDELDFNESKGVYSNGDSDDWDDWSPHDQF